MAAAARREHDPQLKDRVSRLMQFLRELVASKSRPVYRVEQHPAHYWLGEALGFAQFNPVAAPGEAVLRAPRVTLDPPPDLPRELHGWVDLRNRDNSALAEPGLRDSGPAPDLSGRHVEAHEAPQVRRPYDQWLRLWTEWAEVDRLRRPQFELYETLRKMRQQMRDQPESVELVVASGLLEVAASASRGAESIATHLVTQSAVLEQEPETGDILCTFTADSVPRLEDSQLLTGHPDFESSGSAFLRDRLTDAVINVLDAEFLSFLKEWGNRAFNVHLEVGDDSALLSPPSLRPAPALVLRKRGAFALLEYYDQMIKAAAQEGEPVPLGIAQLVEAIEPDDRLEWLEGAGRVSASTLATDPLFPLPANEEQAHIITRLGGDSGVVVEGPPGTGKTHTIANLMSALLARGQRILVTSEKAQALRVLRDKLPDEMQELCVSITDVARGGSAELNRSVASLAARKAGFNPSADDRQIEDLAQRREQLRRRRSQVLEEIRALREGETYQHPPVSLGYQGTAAAIARRVSEGRERYHWVGTPVTGAIPLRATELERLRALIESSTETRRARSVQSVPGREVIPEVADVARLAERCRAGQRAGRAADPVLRRLVEQDEVDLLRLADLLRATGREVTRLQSGSEWARGLADDLLAGRNTYLWERAAGYADFARAAQEADGWVGLARVEGISEPTEAARQAFTQLAEYLSGGGALKKVFKSEAQKAAEPWLGGVRVDGQPITTEEQARKVQAHLDVYGRARALQDLLRQVGVPVEIEGERPVIVGKLLDLQRDLDQVGAFLRAVSELRDVLAEAVSRPTLLGSVDRVEAVTAEATALVDAHDAALARAELARLAEVIGATVATTGAAPEVARLTEALSTADPGAFEEAVLAVEEARREAAEERECDELTKRLTEGSVALLRELERNPSPEVWTPRIADWEAAWAWARAASWLDDNSRPGRDAELGDLLEQLDDDIGRVTAQLAAAQAWRSALSRMTAQQVQALQSYRDNLANVGKGTGKYAEIYRQAARSAMQVAQDAVPAWVMPLQQVLASIPAKQNTFDVVIVDEASQADITSLFLLWLAPRVIVVGDDKQCTPSEVSAGALDKVFERLDSYLGDMPLHLRATLTPRSSIFSMLRTRFGQVVRLREHFRCMPEIITWSSQTFYRDAPLVPVRQFGADRLSPLRTTHVEGGYTEGRYARLHNPVEAEAIVEAIEGCLQDPAYDDKTFGIVVLQGQSQVDVIQNALLHRIPTEVWEERRLRIGTPPDFQGDERHVVFLSMVVSPEQNFATLTKNEYQRRFNVAASRAQDQLWLFHSVTPDRLSPHDLRHSLLTYMRAASRSPVSAIPEGVSGDHRHADFDSLFEQRVFLDLTGRGYHVTPQVEVNSRRIDLVVTGRGSKIAVECDGDAWHSSPEQAESDLAREVELRRCGWTFWRVRESEYYLDKGKALETLWTTLDDLGIGPFQSEDADGGDSGTADVWTPPSLPDDESPLQEEELVALPDEMDEHPPRVALAAFSSEEASHPSKAQAHAPAQADSAPRSTRSYRRMSDSSENETKQIILALAARGPVSNGDIRGATGLEGHRVRELLNRLIEEGRLHRTGEKRGTSYHLVVSGRSSEED